MDLGDRQGGGSHGATVVGRDGPAAPPPPPVRIGTTQTGAADWASLAID